MSHLRKYVKSFTRKIDHDSTSQYDKEVRALVALDELGLHDERRDVVDGVAAFRAHLEYRRSPTLPTLNLNEIRISGFRDSPGRDCSPRRRHFPHWCRRQSS